MSYLIFSTTNDFREHLENMRVFRVSHGSLQEAKCFPGGIALQSGNLPWQDKFNKLVVPIWNLKMPAGSKN